MIELISPHKNATVSLQTDDQKAFIENEAERATMECTVPFQWYNLEKEGIDRSFPSPVSFIWEEKQEPDGNENGFFCLLISETEDMQNPWVYITNASYYDVYNLKTGTKYFWCVQKNGKRSQIFSFDTLLTLPRWLKIEDVSNVRDMGGYPVAGGQIRQGLVYRGGEFELHMHLHPNGIEELRRLRIRTELDMRGEAVGKVDFTTGEIFGIKRVHIPSVPYRRIFDAEQYTALNRFYSVFADPDNYPIYYHCWGGADRTGSFAFILGAFLGMRFEDLIYEYEVTSLSIWGMRSRNYEGFRHFLDLFMALSGETLQEKSITFLKDYASMTDAQLAVIYDMLVEKD